MRLSTIAVHVWMSTTTTTSLCYTIHHKRMSFDSIRSHLQTGQWTARIYEDNNMYFNSYEFVFTKRTSFNGEMKCNVMKDSRHLHEWTRYFWWKLYSSMYVICIESVVVVFVFASSNVFLFVFAIIIIIIHIIFYWIYLQRPSELQEFDLDFPKIYHFMI